MKPLLRGWLPRSGLLLRIGIGMEFRNPLLRNSLLAAAAFGAAIGAANTRDAAATAVWLGNTLSPLLSVIACLWFSGYACRAVDHRRSGILRARAVDGGYLSVILWATGLTVWLLLVAPAFLAAALVQTPFSGTVAWTAQLAALGRTALTVGSMGALAFAASRLLHSRAGGLLIVGGWVVLRLGVGPLQSLQPGFSQNGPLFGFLALLAVAVTALMVERSRRGELRRPAAPAAVVAALALATAAAGSRAGTPRETPAAQGLARSMASQSLARLEPVPGFWLPDGRGGTVRSADYPDQVLLIYLFSADDLRACRNLAVLEQLRKEHPTGDIQPLGICHSNSRAAAWTVAALGNPGFPVGIDVTAPQIPGETGNGEATALRRAYRADRLPLLAVTDRRHRLRAVLTGPAFEPAAIRKAVAERLAEEPADTVKGDAR